MKFIITEVQLFEIVRNTINKVLLPESKQDDLAKEYLRNHGYEDNDTRLKVRGELLRQVPNLKLDKRKFMLAAVRYFCDGQLTDNSSLASFNKALKLIHDGGHTDEFDYDLNGMSLDDLTVKFRDIAKQSGAEDRMRSANRQFTGKSNYTIVPITSYKEAKRYGRYTSWCVTHGKKAYNSYTKGGEKFYFCLRNGFENVAKDAGQNAPLDEYGLSMISVLVDCEGDLDRVTTRWNHEFGGENHPGLSTTEQLEDLLNVNFYNTFVPYTKNELLEKGITPFYAVPEMLAQGVPPKKIFTRIYGFSGGFAAVNLNDKWNFINANNELLSPNKWFDCCYGFYEGLAVVQLGNKWNFINTNGELLSPNKWFDFCGPFHEGLAAVEMNNKYNFINTNCELLSPNQWFDHCWEFNEGLAVVELNDKWNYINVDGELLTNKWFDLCWNFHEGFAGVKLGDKYNYINTNCELLNPNQWFDNCRDFNNGFARVILNGKYNYINTDGEILSPNKWFDLCEDFNNGFARVVLNDKYNFINTNGELLSPNMWFDRCEDFYKGLAKVIRNWKTNYINADGELLSPNMWFDECWNFKGKIAIVLLNNKWNYMNTNGELLSPNRWFDLCWGFKKGIAKVALGSKLYTIDTKGQLYTMDGDPVNSPLQENRRYRKNKKHTIRITEAQLHNAISAVIRKITN